MSKLTKTDDKAQFVEAYHAVMKTGEAFSQISPNIPKVLIKVVQNIHGRFDEALSAVFKASNTKDKEIKLEALNAAKDALFFQYSSIEYIVKCRGLSPGAANTVLEPLKEAYEQVKKWYTSTAKK